MILAEDDTKKFGGYQGKFMPVENVHKMRIILLTLFRTRNIAVSAKGIFPVGLHKSGDVLLRFFPSLC
jgi:hypothetical protein